jgi:hypothetical protein
VQEAQGLIQSTKPPFNPVEPVPKGGVQTVQTTIAPPKKRVHTYSICGVVGHKANQCNQR